MKFRKDKKALASYEKYAKISRELTKDDIMAKSIYSMLIDADLAKNKKGNKA